MNKYHIVVYFSDKINFETYIDSQLNIKEFTDEISEKFNIKNNIFINFIGEDIKYLHLFLFKYNERGFY